MRAAETCDWIDGPKFVDWLERRFQGEIPPHDGLNRRLYDWRRGSACNVYTADEWLTRLGLHLSEVPDELYRTRGPKKPHRYYSETEKQEALKLADRLGSKAEAAARLGCAARSIQAWGRELGVR